MADAGPTSASTSSASCCSRGSRVVFSGVPGFIGSWNRTRRPPLSCACRCSAVRPAVWAKTWMPLVPRSCASYCCCRPPVPVVSPAWSAPPDFSICSALASADGAQQGAGEAAGGRQRKRVGDGPGPGDRGDLVVGDGPAVLAQGNGGDEGLGSGRRDLLGVGGRVDAHQLGQLVRRRGRIRRPQLRFVDADVDDRPVGDELGAAGAQDLGPLRGLGRGAEDFGVGEAGHQQFRAPDRLPLLVRLLQLRGHGVLPLAGTDLPAVVQRDRGGVLLQLQLAGGHRGFCRVERFEHGLEPFIGRTGILAFEGHGADVERGDRGSQLLRSILRAGPAVVAGYERGPQDQADEGKDSL